MLATVFACAAACLGVGAASANAAFSITSLGDLNAQGVGSKPMGLTKVGGSLYFSTLDEDPNLQNVWVRDAVTGATRKIGSYRQDFSPGPTATGFSQMNGAVYFLAGAQNEKQLYRTDGTAAGTVAVGRTRGVGPMVASGGRLYFPANLLSGGDTELWTSDGTDDGTSMLKEIRPGASDSDPAGLTAVAGGIVFAATGPTGRELYRSDGTAAGTGVLLAPPDASPDGDPQGLTAFESPTLGHQVLFSYLDPTTGRELWRTDGTPDGTALVAETNPGTGNGTPENITDVGGTAYFASWAGPGTGTGVYRTDGTAAGTVRLISATGTPDLFTKSGSSVYYVDGGYDHPDQVWRTSGDLGNAVKLLDSTPRDENYPTELTALGGGVVFSLQEHGFAYPRQTELWRIGSTDSSAHRVAEIGPGGYSGAVADLEAFDGSVYFRADDQTHGAELWRVPPLVDQPTLVSDLDTRTLHSDPGNPVAVNDSRFFFTASNGLDSQNLWVSNGTELSTRQVPYGDPAATESAEQLTAFEGKLAFTTTSGLWIADGSVGGSAQRILPAANVKDLTVIGGTLYFRIQRNLDDELWSTDGTVAGTSRFYSGPITGSLVASGDTLYFPQDTSSPGTFAKDLWRTDGTSSGTHLVAHLPDRFGGLVPDGSSGTYLETVNSTTYTLWHSDGTADGTVRLHDFYGPQGASTFTPAKDTLYFLGDTTPTYHSTPREDLWVSNGTPGGTHKVATPSTNSPPYALTAFGSRLFFINGIFGPVFQTDGTDEGTKEVKGDYEPSQMSGRFERIGGRLMFNTGLDVWEIRGNDSDAEATKIAVAPDDIFRIFPFGHRMLFEIWSDQGREPWVGSYSAAIEDPADPPETSIVDKPPARGRSSSVAFTYSGSSDSGAVTFQCKLDDEQFADCPPSGYSKSGLTDGSHKFLVRSVDPFGFSDPTPAEYTFEIDTTPPGTSITVGPSGRVGVSSASITFSSDETGATFECRLDSAQFTPCSSPHDETGISEDSHTFEVRASDDLGNADSSPASISFTVDLTPPETTISAGPTGRVATAANDFSFSSDDQAADFECRFDSGSFEDCASPLHSPALADGPHSFEVRASDDVGNADQSPASRSFEIDTTAPQTTISAGPTGRVATATNEFSFGADDSAARFECRTDDTAFRPCGSPFASRELADGSHTFEVRAIDDLGNADASPARRGYEVDITAPRTAITGAPKALVPRRKSSRPRVSFTFESSERGAALECALDDAAFAPCQSPLRTRVGKGRHVFQVRSVDDLGNRESTPASTSFRVRGPKRSK